MLQNSFEGKALESIVVKPHTRIARNRVLSTFCVQCYAMQCFPRKKLNRESKPVSYVMTATIVQF